MGSLIKNELIKTFRKKSTYIILIILVLFAILTNFIYKNMDSLMDNLNSFTDGEQIEQMKSELAQIQIENDRERYIDLKTDIDLAELSNKYDKSTWQAYIINRDFHGYIYNVNKYKYGTQEEREAFNQNPEDVYKKELEKLEKDDWKQYVKKEVEEIEFELAAVREESKSQSNSKETNERIHLLETRLELAQMRLDKNIPYGDNYLNSAMEVIIENANMDRDYDDDSLSQQDKLQRQQLIESVERAKYILENNKDINNYSSLRGVLVNIFNEYSIFLVIFVVMVAGAIVSSEMEKGTIKMLLVKPHKRWKILLSKYIVSLMMVAFIFVATLLIEILVGGVMLGFDSLSIPEVVYNFSTNSIQEYNIFTYVLIISLTKLPIYILLATLAFAVGCLFGNSVLAIVLPIIGNIGGAVVGQLISSYSIKQLAIFPTLNWDFSQFLFGRLPGYQYTNVGFATGVCIAYEIIMIFIAWRSFTKKEIKNI